MKRYFDDICASKESQLYGAESSVEDNEEVKELRRAIASDPENGGLYIKLGDALSYQLRYIEAISAYSAAIRKKNMNGYQKRGIRYLTTLQLSRASEDFKVCASFGPRAEIELLSGLTAYMQRRYETAKAYFDRWISIAADDTEELTAVIYWYILCCVKSGDANGMKEILKRYSPDMYIGHHTAYQCGIDLFSGTIGLEEAMCRARAADGEDRDLEFSMIAYAAANYEYWHGNTAGYMALLDEILLRDTFWAGVASLAALNDRHPEVAQNAERRGEAVMTEGEE